MTNTKEPRQWWIRKRLQKGVNYAFDPDNVEMCEENAKHDFWIVVEKSDYLALQEKLDVATQALECVARHDPTKGMIRINPQGALIAIYNLAREALALINKTEGE